MRLLTRLIAFLAAAMLAAQPVAAQSILRDAETEAFLDEISAPLIEAAGLEPDNVEIILINDPSINAFVAGGQAVYIHSGLIDAADSAEEVQGVIAPTELPVSLSTALGQVGVNRFDFTSARADQSCFETGGVRSDGSWLSLIHI